MASNWCGKEGDGKERKGVGESGYLLAHSVSLAKCTTLMNRAHPPFPPFEKDSLCRKLDKGRPMFIIQLGFTWKTAHPKQLFLL